MIRAYFIASFIPKTHKPCLYAKAFYSEAGNTIGGLGLKRISAFFTGVLLFTFLGTQVSLCQTFTLSGYENLTSPGCAHLILTITPVEESWSNLSLRVQISGAMAGTLVFPSVKSETDLGYFSLDAGNYTFDFYVLDKFGATVEQSGSVTAHDRVEFTIPEPPKPPEKKKPIIDPVNLGFMITALFIFGLVLAIYRTTGRPTTSHTESGDL